jgi:hypothetical protein
MATLLPAAVLMPAATNAPKLSQMFIINNIYYGLEIVTINLFDLDFSWM